MEVTIKLNEFVDIFTDVTRENLKNIKDPTMRDICARFYVGVAIDIITSLYGAEGLKELAKESEKYGN